MKRSWRIGFSFGLTSGIITTIGLMVGLTSGTGSKVVVIAGIITIAIADALSDSVGMHICQEYDNNQNHKEIWESTVSTFIFKFLFSSFFVMPILFLPLEIGVIIGIIFGLYLIISISYFIAKERNANPIKAIGEHVLITLLVIIITHYVGQLISQVL